MFLEIRKLCDQITIIDVEESANRPRIHNYDEWCDFSCKQDELDLYLLENCPGNSANILQYWRERVRIIVNVK